MASDDEVRGSKKTKLEKTMTHRRKTLNPNKLLLTKWTALAIVAKQKHFIVSRIIVPLEDQQNISEVEIEAVYSKQTQIIQWKTLLDTTIWQQGWR